MGVICPCCGTDLGTELKHSPVAFSKRQQFIYDTVKAAGADGISTKKLVNAVYKNKPSKGAGVVVRVQIHEMNRFLEPFKQKIASVRDRGYFLLPRS